MAIHQTDWTTAFCLNGLLAFLPPISFCLQLLVWSPRIKKNLQVLHLSGPPLKLLEAGSKEYPSQEEGGGFGFSLNPHSGTQGGITRGGRGGSVAGE